MELAVVVFVDGPSSWFCCLELPSVTVQVFASNLPPPIFVDGRLFWFYWFVFFCFLGFLFVFFVVLCVVSGGGGGRWVRAGWRGSRPCLVVRRCFFSRWKCATTMRAILLVRRYCFFQTRRNLETTTTKPIDKFGLRAHLPHEFVSQCIFTALSRFDIRGSRSLLTRFYNRSGQKNREPRMTDLCLRGSFCRFLGLRVTEQKTSDREPVGLAASVSFCGGCVSFSLFCSFLLFASSFLLDVIIGVVVVVATAALGVDNDPSFLAYNSFGSLWGEKRTRNVQRWEVPSPPMFQSGVVSFMAFGHESVQTR